MEIEGATVFSLGQPVPREFHDALARQAENMNGILVLEESLVILRIKNPSKREIREFSGPAMMRVGDFGSFMLVSPMFRTYSFDLLWSPGIARKGGEQPLVQNSPDERFLLNLILIDESGIIRAMRPAILGPKTFGRLARTQAALLDRDVNEAKLDRDMRTLFSAHPKGIPDEAFSARCRIGS